VQTLLSLKATPHRNTPHLTFLLLRQYPFPHP
jgi:hypothetical protein